MGHGQQPGSELVSTEGVKARLEQLQMLLSVMERASRFGERQGNWVLIIRCFFVIQDIQYEIWRNLVDYPIVPIGKTMNQ